MIVSDGKLTTLNGWSGQAATQNPTETALPAGRLSSCLPTQTRYADPAGRQCLPHGPGWARSAARDQASPVEREHRKKPPGYEAAGAE